METDNKKPLNIIILGRSGSGKGTQAKFLCEKFGLEYIGTGVLLRDFAERDNIASRKVKRDLAEGKLVPTWMAFFLWMEKLSQTPEEQGVLFDGSPRKIGEAELLDSVLEWYGRNLLRVILIDISREEAMKRMINRRVCSKCGRSFYVSHDSGDVKCVYCGGDMVIRPEDNPQAIEKRLNWFDDEVSKNIDFYEKKGILIRVNGEQPIEKVFQDMVSTLEDSL